MYDLGDTVNLTAVCRDSAGALANATNADLTVTKPDGEVDTPSVTNPPAQTGRYAVAYVPTQAGRHTYRWTFTGDAPNQAHVDVFQVWPSAVNWIVGLAETKDALNIDQDNIAHDEELRRAIAGSSAVVEDIVGIVAVRSFTETYSGGDSVITLRRRPVLAVESVTENGSTVDPAGYSVRASGLLFRVSGSYSMCWTPGTDNIGIVYSAGRPVVDDNILDGTRDLIRANFRPQVGGNYSPFDANPARPESGQMRLGFFVPNSVMQRLNPSSIGPMVA